MKSGHKALGSLLILIGILINPFLLSFLFSNDGNISSFPVISAIIVIEIVIVLFGVTVYKTSSGLVMKWGLVSASVLLSLTLSVGLDRFYGAYIMPETANLLFPAFSVAKHETSEFDLSVNINNLGFRGANTTIKKKQKRVLLIGDSFTFGWGVELEKTWVSLLSESYPEIEFLNLGQGGNHPGDYVQIAKRAIPFLKPDLVFVNVLQGNDIHQLMRVIEFEEGSAPLSPLSQSKESTSAQLARYIGLVFPNFTRRFPRTVSIQERWKADAAALLDEFNEVEMERYLALPLHVRVDFETGTLNPSLIYESIHHPNMFRVAADTSDILCQKGTIRLRDHLLELKNLTEENGAKLIIINLPNRPYGLPSECSPLEKLGFSVSGCDTMNAGLTTKLACAEASLNLLSPSIKGAGMFYEFDGHWNPDGNRIFAEQLIIKLDSLPEWKHFLTSSNF